MTSALGAGGAGQKTMKYVVIHNKCDKCQWLRSPSPQPFSPAPDIRCRGRKGEVAGPSGYFVQSRCSRRVFEMPWKRHCNIYTGNLLSFAGLEQRRKLFDYYLELEVWLS